MNLVELVFQGRMNMLVIFVGCSVLILLLWALDIAYESIWLPILSYLVMVVVVGLILNFELLWFVLLIPIIVAAAIVTQYTIWRRWLLPNVLSRFAPTKYSASASRFVGEIGTAISNDEGVFISVYDELWKCVEDVEPGDRVRITGVESGRLRVSTVVNKKD